MAQQWLSYGSGWAMHELIARDKKLDNILELWLSIGFEFISFWALPTIGVSNEAKEVL